VAALAPLAPQRAAAPSLRSSSPAAGHAGHLPSGTLMAWCAWERWQLGVSLHYPPRTGPKPAALACCWPPPRAQLVLWLLQRSLLLTAAALSAARRGLSHAPPCAPALAHNTCRSLQPQEQKKRGGKQEPKPKLQTQINHSNLNESKRNFGHRCTKNRPDICNKRIAKRLSIRCEFREKSDVPLKNTSFGKLKIRADSREI